MNVTAFGFTAGGEYTWGNYAGPSTGLLAQRAGLRASTNWALSTTYTAGPIRVGGFYGQGTRDNGNLAVIGNGISVAGNTLVAAALPDRRQTVWGFGAAYTIAPGMDLVANYTRVNDRNLANNALNPLYIVQSRREIDFFMLGTRIAF